MGSDHSSLSDFETIPKQFKQLRSLPGIYENKHNGTRLQKHYVDINCAQQISYEKQIFIFRRLHQQRLVAGRYFEKIQPTQFCGSFFRISYFTEIPLGPNYKPQKISTRQAIQMIIHCLQGYQLLYEQFGGFQVNSNQLYFYPENRIKVWIDEDASKSRPYRSCERQKVVEQYMISQIFKIFDHLYSSCKHPCEFTTYLRRLETQERNLVNFMRTIRYMIQIQQKLENKGNEGKKKQVKRHIEQINKNYKIVKPTCPKVRRSMEETSIFDRKKYSTCQQQNIQPTFLENQTLRINSIPSNMRIKVQNNLFMGSTRGFQKNSKKNNEQINQKPLQAKISIRNFNEHRMLMRRSAEDYQEHHKLTSKKMDQLSPIKSRKYFQQNKNSFQVSQSEFHKVSSQQSTTFERKKPYTLVKDPFMQKLTTVKSILHPTDINIDSEILLDVKDLDSDQFNFGKSTF